MALVRKLKLRERYASGMAMPTPESLSQTRDEAVSRRLVPTTQASSQPADPFAEIEVPAALQASLARHRANLAGLIRNLQIAGVDTKRIEESVSVLVDSYKAELLNAIKTLMEPGFV